MKIKKSIVITLLLLAVFGFTAANAKDAKNLSLNEAISLSIKNSGQLRISQAKIDQAVASLQEARERRLPDVKISGSYLRIAQPTIDLKLKLGGSGGTDTSGSGGGASSVKVNEAMYGILNASVPIFSGFRINAGIESAKYLAQAAKLDATKDKDEVIENTIAAYSNLYKAKAAMDLVQENLKQSKQRVADFSNLESNGLVARNDLLKVELQQSNVELTLLDAENNYKIAMINMNLMLGLPESTELVTEVVDMSATNAKETPIEDWEAMALQNRQDAAALALREKAANANVKAAKGEYYPSLALTGGYIAADIPNVLTITNAVNAGIGLSYSPSSLWKAGAKVKQAKARQAELEATQGTLRDYIRIQINQSYENYLVSQKKIEVYAKAVTQADENYKITRNKYDNALATTTDLLEADVAQLQAKLNYAFAKADAMVAYNKLLQTSGTLAENTINK